MFFNLILNSLRIILPIANRPILQLTMSPSLCIVLDMYKITLDLTMVLAANIALAPAFCHHYIFRPALSSPNNHIHPLFHRHNHTHPREEKYLIPTTSKQCCGAENFCFRSGSDFQKVLAPELAPAPTLALYLPFITNFIFKSGFFMFFMKEYQANSHAGFYTI